MMNKVFLDSNFLIYANAMPAQEDSGENQIDTLYKKILKEYVPYSNVLVLDEVVYISKSKYGISYEDTLIFLKQNILPFTSLVKIDLEIFNIAEKYMLKYKIKPADSLRLACMQHEGIRFIVSEDAGFDQLEKQERIERIWV